MLADILDIQVVLGMRVDREGLRRVVAEIVARTECFQTPVRFPLVDQLRAEPSVGISSVNALRTLISEEICTQRCALRRLLA